MAESLAEFFLEHFQAHRRETAYRQRRGYRTESFTYGEVLDLALDFTRKLEALGISKGDRIMLWGENGAEWVAAFFGCALAGVVVVPMDDGATTDFALKVVHQVEAKLLVGPRRRLAAAPVPPPAAFPAQGRGRAHRFVETRFCLGRNLQPSELGLPPCWPG